MPRTLEQFARQKIDAKLVASDVTVARQSRAVVEELETVESASLQRTFACGLIPQTASTNSFGKIERKPKIKGELYV